MCAGSTGSPEPSARSSAKEATVHGVWSVTNRPRGPRVLEFSRSAGQGLFFLTILAALLLLLETPHPWKQPAG